MSAPFLFAMIFSLTSLSSFISTCSSLLTAALKAESNVAYFTPVSMISATASDVSGARAAVRYFVSLMR